MKTTAAVLVLAVAVAASRAWAQGTLYFANGAVGVSSPIYEADGVTKLSGPDYLAGLWWSPVPTETNAEAMYFSGLTAPLHTGINAGYFFGGVKPIPGAPAQAYVAVQVRAWRVQDGADFFSAQAKPGGHWGESNFIQVYLTSGPQPPRNLVGLQSFNLTVTPLPEPSAFTLAVLGGAVLLLCRRVRPRR